MQNLSDLPLPPGVSADPATLEKQAQKLMAQQGVAIQESIGEEPLEQVDSASAATQEVEAPEVQAAPEPAPVESKQAKNFKELKNQMMRLQRERDAMARQLQEKQQAQVQTVQTNTVQADDPDHELEFRDDEYIEAKHVNKVAQELKKVKQQLKQFQSQSTVSLAEQRLRAEFPDFAKVFTNENCQTLAMIDPDLALSIDADTDPYRKAKLAYKSIKNLGIDSTDEHEEEKARIQKNLSKPRPASSVASTSSPLSKASSFENGLTPELQKQLYAEMMAARKGM